VHLATLRGKKPGVWEVRAVTGRIGLAGRPRSAGPCIGTKKDAQRVAAGVSVKPSKSGGRTVAELLDAWLELNEATWAPATVRDERSRAELIKADRCASPAREARVLEEVDAVWVAVVRV
jgi:hypothetical protein